MCKYSLLTFVYLKFRSLHYFQAHTKYVKARQALDASESNYQSSVSSVEETRMAWEKETERSLAVFQSLEEER